MLWAGNLMILTSFSDLQAEPLPPRGQTSLPGAYLGLDLSEESLMSCGADATAGFPPEKQV